MNKFVEKFHKLTENYLNEMKYTGRSQQTCNNYKKRLKYFEDFWSQGNPTSDPTREDIRAWRDHELQRGISPATVKQYMIELAAFFNYCVDDEIYAENPVTKRMFPKQLEQEYS